MQLNRSKLISPDLGKLQRRSPRYRDWVGTPSTITRSFVLVRYCQELGSLQQRSEFGEKEELASAILALSAGRVPVRRRGMTQGGTWDEKEMTGRGLLA